MIEPLRISFEVGCSPDHAFETEVEIVFREMPDSTTRVEIEHGGWDRLGEMGQAWRDANHAGWDGVLPPYVEAARS